MSLISLLLCHLQSHMNRFDSRSCHSQDLWYLASFFSGSISFYPSVFGLSCLWAFAFTVLYLKLLPVLPASKNLFNSLFICRCLWETCLNQLWLASFSLLHRIEIVNLFIYTYSLPPHPRNLALICFIVCVTKKKKLRQLQIIHSRENSILNHPTLCCSHHSILTTFYQSCFIPTVPTLPPRSHCSILKQNPRSHFSYNCMCFEGQSVFFCLVSPALYSVPFPSQQPVIF